MPDRTSKARTLPLTPGVGGDVSAEAREDDTSRNRALEQALADAEQRYQALIGALPVIVYRAATTPPFAPTYVSAGVRVLGYSPEEWLADPSAWQQRIHHDDRDRALEDIRRALRSSTVFSCEYRMIARNGMTRWFHHRAQLTRESGGRLTSWQGVLLDVTDRRMAEMAMRESEELFRSLTEQSSEIISIVSRDGIFRYVSPSVEHVLDWGPYELIGQTFLAFMHPDEVQLGLDTLAGMLTEPGARRTLRVRFRTRDGSYRWLEASATNLVDHPVVSGIIVNSRDITSRIDAEAETRFQARLLDAVNEAVIALSPTGRVTYWNRFAEELFGWMREEVMGQLLSEYIIADPGPDDLERLRSAIRGETAQYERLLKRRDGGTFLASVAGSPIVGTDGVITGAVGVVSDITPQRQLEEQLRQSQKMQAVGQLAGGVAHDFNNLLTVISGHIDLLRASDPTSSDWQADIEEIAHAADRAAALTKQLLAFSRKQMLKPRLVDVNTIVRGVTPMLRRLIGEDVELVTRLPADLPQIRADANQLEQVLMNLVVNARDAVSSAGVVVVSTRTEQVDARRARALHRAEGPYVVLSVNDNGTGMDERTRSRIFEPFFTTKERGRGTGLGLSTVYGIAEQSGGFVTVVSELGTGSTFDVYLPATELAAPATAEPGSALTAAAGRETILIAEDSDQVRRLAERILRTNGYAVLTARDGREALDIALSHAAPIDLVLTDVIMPQMNGRELAEALAEQRPAITVVFMSGYTDDEIVRRGILDPASRFIEKPFTASTLVEKIRFHLDTARAAR